MLLTEHDPKPPPMTRVSIAAAIGNTIEVYDYAAFGFLTTILAKHFFPSQTPGAALLSTFAVFGAAFFARPVGALIFGPLGDRIGRRPTLVLTLVLVAGSTALIGVLPTADSIGVLAPILLVVLRLIQGLSIAGEYSGAITYVAEFAPHHRRGTMTSRVQIGSIAGLLLAALVVLLLNSILTPDQMAGWGWRLVFLLAAPMGLVGVYIRSKLGETPEFENLEKLGKTDRHPIRDAFVVHWRTAILIFGIAGLHALGYYMAYSYTQSYLITLGFTPREATLVSVGALIVGVGLVIVGGMLSDRLGRWRMAMGLSLFVFLTSYAFFTGLSAARTVGMALLWTILVSVGPVLYTSIAPAMYIESIPAPVRATVFAIGYNVALAALAGPALYVSQLLVSQTGDSRAPAYLLMFGALLSFAASFAVKRRTKASYVLEEVDRQASPELNNNNNN